ncbi:DUF6220 domain-containing protein [Planotetraspora sp. A-T 1434]|uniref:DUF6220 domain-containing protein n=1 Tax=Planotetraspora sp. A-T 1434 TaxID=2979219 RepID=UPI0021BECA78|nr:DUF6220 domain-containing protein [Planotetraspora sp. A-T 1434]MCT9930501.1 DUF6220 domain-containing protein [Planotetraspora sp. A-T 1434]
MRKAYFVLTVLQLVAVLAQFYFATFGAFEIPHPAPGDPNAAIGYHIINGTMIIPVISIIVTIAAALAKAGGRLVGLSIVPFVLVAVQLFVIFPLAEIAGATETKTTTAALAVMGFHALDGVAILAVAVILVRKARALAKDTVLTRSGTEVTTPA